MSSFRRDDLLKDIGRVQWVDGKVDVHQLADKIIHTWWIIPATDEASGLAGFIFTTDKQKNKELWLLPTRSIVEAFERFSSSEIREIHSKRDGLGRLSHWEAK